MSYNKFYYRINQNCVRNLNTQIYEYHSILKHTIKNKHFQLGFYK